MHILIVSSVLEYHFSFLNPASKPIAFPMIQERIVVVSKSATVYGSARPIITETGVG